MAAFVCAAGASPRAEGESPWSVRVWSGDGLTDRYIVGATQTADGFLWLATASRLARFDGARFEEFKLSDVAEAQDRRIRGIVGSRAGGLWIATQQAQLVHLGAEGAQVLTEGLPDLIPESLLEDAEGALWISYYRDGPVCRIKDGRVETFTNEESPQSKCVLTVDGKGRLWFVRNGEIGIFRDGGLRPFPQRAVSSARIVGASTGGLWVAATNGLFRCEEDGTLQRLPGVSGARFAGSPSALLEDRHGALWIGTFLDGLYRYTASGGLERVPTSYPEVTSLTEDREGNVWVGTAGGGLNRVSPRAVTVEGRATALPHEALHSVCEDSTGTFWATTQNGTIVQRRQGQWEPGPASLPARATCVVPDPRGGLWIGVRDRQQPLHRWRDGELQTWAAPEGIVSHTIATVVVARDGTVWLGGENPTTVQRLRDGRFENLVLPRSIGRVQSMIEDPHGRIWIGGEQGALLRVEGDTLIDATPADSPRSAIRGLHALPDGALLLGYKTAGIGWLEHGALTRIGAAEGLYSDAVSHLVPDELGWLWCGGDDGVFKIRLQSLAELVAGRLGRVQSVHYGAGQEVPKLQTTAKAWGSAFRSRDGRIWIPMNTALVIADPSRARENLEPAPVLLTQVRVDGRLVARYTDLLPAAPAVLPPDAVQLPTSTPLRLAPIRQRIDFAFTTLSFAAPENAHFRYRLIGDDAEWIEAGTQRTASYTRLPAGSYRFHVQACNSDGVWNETGAVLAFMVAPFYWETWWFRGLMFGGFTLGTVLLVRRVSHRRLHRKLQVLRQQMALEKERARIARDLHDDAGNRLTRVLLLSKLAHREREHPDKAAAHLEQLSAAARDATSALDEVVWAVNPHNDTLSELIAHLGQFAMELCQAGGLACHLDFPAHLPNRTVPTDVRHNLFLAAKEAVHNAVRHAQATEVRLSATVDDRKLVITVADNGCGLPPSPAGAGADGLRNLRQRMEEIDGRFEIDTAPGTGTRLTFSYPWPRAK